MREKVQILLIQMNKNRKKPDGLRIIQAIDAGGWGGAENVVVKLANGLAKRGHYVEVWVRRGSFLSEKLIDDVKVKVVPFLNDYEPFTTARFVHALRNYDIVNVHLGRAARVSGYAAKIPPNINSQRMSGLILENASSKSAWPFGSLNVARRPILITPVFFGTSGTASMALSVFIPLWTTQVLSTQGIFRVTYSSITFETQMILL